MWGHLYYHKQTLVLFREAMSPALGDGLYLIMISHDKPLPQFPQFLHFLLRRAAS